MKQTSNQGLSDDRVVPEADALEQREPVGDEAADETNEVPEIADRPEADVLEQAQPVQDDQIVDRSTRHDDTSEADWLDQSIAEPVEEERR